MLNYCSLQLDKVKYLVLRPFVIQNFLSHVTVPLDSVLGRHSSRRSKTASKKSNHDVPSKKNWIYNPPPPAAQTVPATQLAAPYSAAYYQPVFVRNSPPQSRPVSSSTSYVQGNQRSVSNKLGPVNRGLNQQGNQHGLQQQVQNTRVKNINAVLRRQHLRRKALREG